MADTFLLTSDLHGSLAALDLIIQQAIAHKVTSILLAGDFCPSDNPMFTQLMHQGPPFILVRGNCDSSYDFSLAMIPLPPLKRYLNWENRTICMYHGHMYPHVSEFKLSEGDILFTGHTHVPKIEMTEQGIIWVNSGSPAYPRSSVGSTYGLLADDGISIRSLGTGKIIKDMEYHFRPKSDQ